MVVKLWSVQRFGVELKLDCIILCDVVLSQCKLFLVLLSGVCLAFSLDFETGFSL